MEARFDKTSSNINPFMISHDQRRDNYEHYSPSSTDKGSESPSSSFFNDHPILHKISSVVTSSKRSGSTGRRAVLKRVVTIPIKEVEAGSRLKGDMSCSSTTTPPSDSWAWRKYGQKPIKGSPYPRGYYRCSSSKGCPARKQVERSRVDPTMLVITYSAEHSHPWPPPSRNHHQQHQQQSSIRRPILIETPPAQPDPDPEAESEDKFANLVEDTMIAGDEFRWFGDMETTTSTVLENPIFSECGGVNSTSDMAMVFPMREEDESLFADLGELPECSVVFRHQRGVGPELEIC